MSPQPRTRSARLHDDLTHPVIDSDAHLQELTNLLRSDILAEALETGGPALAKRVERNPSLTIDEFMRTGWYVMTEQERRDQWIPCPAWWGQPTTTLDRAASYLPALLYDRLDDLGIDYMVLYPSLGLTLGFIDDEEIRRLACRVYNRTYWAMYEPFADRMTPVAVIPMVTPDEAVDELNFAVGELGYKSIAIHHVRRPVPLVGREAPQFGRYAQRLETYGIDSDYDYDPFWRRCVELGAPVGVHASEQSWGSRRSPSRYAYNHIGAFAAAADSICKSIFMGGVTRRFPSLNFAFLEGGVGWACTQLSDMVSHWEKRGGANIGQLDPDRVDVPYLLELVDEYGTDEMRSNRDLVEQFFRRPEHRAAELDDWRACEIAQKSDFKELFVVPFYFGCEADDPINAWAFHTDLNPIGERLKILFSSDIGHWDVPDITEVVGEAYELVERELISERDFEAFVFSNPVDLYVKGRPDFFEGTSIEREVEVHRARHGVS
jgi:predicted TIM-barrel fold metal-dependent hydrolase